MPNDHRLTNRIKAALAQHMEFRGLTVAELQRLMGLPHREQADRVLRLDHRTSLETLDAACTALGIELGFDMTVTATKEPLL